MRISDWSSDVCSSDLASSRIPSGIGDALLNNERLVVVAFLTYCGLVTATVLKNHRIAVAVLVDFNFVKNCTGLRDKRFSAVALLRNVDFVGVRSEEHTSELQSLMRISYAVFCLKKKKKTKHKTANGV